MSDDPKRPAEEGERLSRLSSAAAPEQEPDLVGEYEMRHQEPHKVRAMPRSYSTMNVSEEERLWAAIAHASIWVTILGGIFTIGFVVPVSIFIPLGIYFLYRKKSDYVVFHALQAFVLQLVGTVGVLALAVLGSIIWVIGLVIALLAIFVLAGVVIAPLWVILGIILGLVICLTPLLALLFGTIAAIETYNRRDYRYPFIARWVDRQLAGGFLNTTV
jgi:uncharacterized Tic20 family protein